MDFYPILFIGWQMVSSNPLRAHLVPINYFLKTSFNKNLIYQIVVSHLLGNRNW